MTGWFGQAEFEGLAVQCPDPNPVQVILVHIIEAVNGFTALDDEQNKDIWGIDPGAGNEAINTTFIQPFVSYTTPDAWTFALNTESTYDWNNEQWSVPINATIAKLVTLGSQPISITGGARYWAESPDAGPEGWGYRLVVTFLFPK